MEEFNRQPFTLHDNIRVIQTAIKSTIQPAIFNGRINAHHECQSGRWRVTFDGFEAQVVDNAFLVTVDWENHDGRVERVGSYTVSGRFEGRNLVRGGFISSVNDIRRRNEQPNGDVCTTVQVSFEGVKEE